MNDIFIPGMLQHVGAYVIFARFIFSRHFL